mgnify:CR=1 FL=1
MTLFTHVHCVQLRRYTLAECYSATATTTTCAPASTFGSHTTAASEIATARSGLLELWTKKTCMGGWKAQMSTDVGTLASSVTSLQSSMADLQVTTHTLQGFIQFPISSTSILHTSHHSHAPNPPHPPPPPTNTHKTHRNRLVLAMRWERCRPSLRTSTASTPPGAALSSDVV